MMPYTPEHLRFADLTTVVSALALLGAHLPKERQGHLAAILFNLSRSQQDYSRIPRHIRAAMDAWGREAHPHGDFLKAVFTNNLNEACARADLENQRALPAIALYTYNELPNDCWGTPARYAEWKARGARERLKQSGIVHALPPEEASP